MAWSISTSGSAVWAAGANVNSTITASGSALLKWSDDAESFCTSVVRKDVVANWTSLTANGKEIIQELHDSLIAQRIIGYEPEAIGTSASTLRLNILENNIDRIVALLKEDNTKKYLNIT